MPDEYGTHESPSDSVANGPGSPGPSLAGVSGSLSRTRPWVRLLAVLGFLTVGLTIVIALGIGVFGMVSGYAEALVPMVVYPLIGLLYVFPSLYLWQYSQRIADFVAAEQRLDHLEQALEAQRKFWKFVGILAVVSFAVSALVIAAILLGLSREVNAL